MGSLVVALGVALGVSSTAFLSPAIAQTGTLQATDSSVQPAQSFLATVKLTADAAVEGFSVGLSHDETLLTLDSLVPGPTLDSARGGLDPDIFIPNSSLADGFTVGVVLDLSFPFATLAAGVDNLVLEATYTVNPTAVPQSTLLSFSDELGTPPVENVIVSDTVELPVTRVDGVITILPAGPLFIRGDADHNGLLEVGDSVGLLFRVFGVIVEGTCADAEDANDDGVRDISDGTFVIAFLFSGGAPIPAPFPACGTDATDTDTLDCNDFGACP